MTDDIILDEAALVNAVYAVRGMGWQSKRDMITAGVKAYLSAANKPPHEASEGKGGTIHPADLLLQYFRETGVPEEQMDLGNIGLFREYCDQRVAAMREPDGDGWNYNMDEAPRDGEVIQAYREDAGVFPIYWTEARVPGGYEVGDEMWFTVFGEDLTGDMPTAWRLLSNPPAESAQGA